MTEDEAKTKLCPVSLLMNNDSNGNSGFCLASACMMWRLEKTTLEEKLRSMTIEEQAKFLANDFERQFGNGRAAKADGYCGLAGKP